MRLIFILILPVPRMIVRMMLYMTMSFGSLSMVRRVMCWDMGCVGLVHLDTVFLEDLFVSRIPWGKGKGAYGSSVFFCFCANLPLVQSSSSSCGMGRHTLGLWSALVISN